MTLLPFQPSPPSLQRLLLENLIDGLQPEISAPSDRYDLWQVALPTPYDKQVAFIESPAKRKIIRAGRRGGKTTGIGILAGRGLVQGRRVLYVTPTQEQIDSFWHVITTAFYNAIERGYLYKNETRHIIGIPHSTARIQAKTAWNADTMRGGYGDLLIFDEYQLMNEDAWGVVGAPMMIDTDGDAVFIYTPPSIRTSGTSKAHDPRHAAKLFKKAEQDQTGRWATFHFTSWDNPHNKGGVEAIADDMTQQAIRQEILAIDEDEVPGALWTRKVIDDTRHRGKTPDMKRIVVAIDPAGSSRSTANQTALSVCGEGVDGHGYLLHTEQMRAKPAVWAQAAIDLYDAYEADAIVCENNFGGEMVEGTIEAVDNSVNVIVVHASRGKIPRAEPVAAKYEKGLIHHVGKHDEAEEQLCTYTPGNESPDLLDSIVWGFTELLIEGAGEVTPDSPPDWWEDFRGL